MTLGWGHVTDHSIRVRKGTKPLNNSRKPLSDKLILWQASASLIPAGRTTGQDANGPWGVSRITS